jgi:hypothetical protein
MGSANAGASISMRAIRATLIADQRDVKTVTERARIEFIRTMTRTHDRTASPQDREEYDDELLGRVSLEIYRQQM